MSDDFDERLNKEIAEEERGTWREDLRADYDPWFDTLDLGFQCRDGWRELIASLFAEIAEIVGGPQSAPNINVVQVKQKLGYLRCYVWSVPEEHRDAVREAIQRAFMRSSEICEDCGDAGSLRCSRCGYWHVACDEHVIE